MQSEGVIPKGVWNEQAKVIEHVQKIRGQGGIAVKESSTGKEVSFVRNIFLPFTFQNEGLLVEVAQNISKRLYLFEPVIIHNVVAYVETPSSSGSVIIDVHLCDDLTSLGTTIFTTQANRPTIIASEYVDLLSEPDIKHIPAGKFLQIDADGIGTGAAALTVVIYGT